MKSSKGTSRISFFRHQFGNISGIFQQTLWRGAIIKLLHGTKGFLQSSRMSSASVCQLPEELSPRFCIRLRYVGLRARLICSGFVTVVGCFATAESTCIAHNGFMRAKLIVSAAMRNLSSNGFFNKRWLFNGARIVVNWHLLSLHSQ